MKRIVSAGIAAACITGLLSTSGFAAGDDAPINGNGPSARRAASAEVAGAPEPSPSELIYVPVTPCRAFFTPTAMAKDETRSFQITGSGSFSAQGGSKTGCGVPAAASAVAINFTVTNPSGTGYVRAFAEGTEQPGATTLSFKPGGNETGSAIVALGETGKVSVFLSGSPLRVVGDITGYFAPQIQVYMNPTGTPYAGTTRIVSTSRLGTGSYKIETDRNLQLCSVHVNIAGGYYYATAYPSGNSIYVTTWAISSGTPTPTDLYFNASAKC